MARSSVDTAVIAAVVFVDAAARAVVVTFVAALRNVRRSHPRCSPRWRRRSSVCFDAGDRRGTGG
jgi:hypothetical protein